MWYVQLLPWNRKAIVLLKNSFPRSLERVYVLLRIVLVEIPYDLMKCLRAFRAIPLPISFGKVDYIYRVSQIYGIETERETQLQA